MASWPELIGALLARESLDSARTAWAMDQIMAGAATPAQIAGFAVALRAKGETPAEIGGLIAAMRAHAAPLRIPDEIRARAVDTCGTGGDRSNTVNLSTMAALVVAGAGVPVIKHGNRAASSACGSADLLAELGVAIDLPPAGVEACLRAAGIAFCFARIFHPAMRHVGGPRAEIGVPTAFNILGPLTNPAEPGAQAVGVADARLAPVVAQVLADRGTRALVFRGDDGLDELTPTTTSTIWVIPGGQPSAAGEAAGQTAAPPRREQFDPRDVGIHVPDIAVLRGADAPHNAAVTRALLAGEPGPVRDTVLLAAAASLVAAAGPTDAAITEQIAAALPRAAHAIDSGAAAAVLDRWTDASQAAAAAAAIAR
ncbi:Anthranilate phosphoribosyltransferase 1 [Frankia alni ACN14a]|uniref:Anthranilate phosphoribosyltransferase n=1 Tax=Frankia alni (strain DSM 45986 / CECT 9034 / ACN14a) TaxID=326424 RepID=TRPD_FRAAA|nr:MULTISPECIES: anthranilate phosphoribosyltransferase [Frankia]Q0RFI3.1 RecName: Full=Anthranilate phosphoribosyltransferase [Frankia alni ACN14a]CAJ63760.1 Anthranilate phosphoribosyltransferase 1 [Frankia alni ACN14a]